MTIACARCDASAPDRTTECHECGYDPGRSMLLVGGVIFGLGLLSSLFLLGIPIAVYGLYRIARSRRLTIESDYAL